MRSPDDKCNRRMGRGTDREMGYVFFVDSCTGHGWEYQLAREKRVLALG